MFELICTGLLALASAVLIVFLFQKINYEKKYRLIFKSSAHTLLFTEDYKITDCNCYAEELLYLPCERIIGRDIRDFFSEVQVEGRSAVEVLKEIRNRAFNEGGSEGELRILTENGREHFVQVQFIARGRIGKRVYGVVRDVDYKKRLEFQIRQSQKLEVVGLLSRGIAHDFNNVLMSILGNAELLDMKLGEESPVAKHVEAIMDGAKRAKDLAVKITRFSDRDSFLQGPVNIHEILDSSVDFLERTLDRKISVVKSYAASNAVVTGDSPLIQSVFLNIGINAAESMTDCGVLTFATNDVEIDEEFCKNDPFNAEPGMYVEISVSDTGSGMSKDVLNRAFQPFYTTKSGESAGLGLSAVYSVVRDHGGLVKVYSEKGLGTVVNLFFPVESDSLAAIEKDDLDIIMGSGTVMVIDDDAMVLATTSAQLRSLGFDVIEFENVLSGIDYYREKGSEIRLVIIDINMPDINGLEAASMIRKIRPDSKILMSSGFSEEFVFKGMDERDEFFFIQKPFVLKTLSQRVSEILGLA